MKKLIIILLLLFPFITLATDTISLDRSFEAQVVKILEQKNNTLPDGTAVLQQDVELKGLEGEWENKEIIFKGIGNFDLIKKNIYKAGEKVMVLESSNADGDKEYYITDYVRTDALLWLFAIFILVLTAVSSWKGLRSLLALIVSFLVLTKYIIPQILAGANPIFVTLIGSFFILLAIIYITEGFVRKAHLAVVSIFVSLVITIIFSQLFIELGKLSGISSEEISFLVNIGGKAINFKGLLLAGIIIGALGVLDDVVISQIVSVEEIAKANYAISRKELFFSAYKIGVSHISSMTNTLFLAYAGASMPLLILFISGQSAFSSFSQIINNENIATEIIRTVAGSLGLILSVPISTLLAVFFVKRKPAYPAGRS